MSYVKWACIVGKVYTAFTALSKLQSSVYQTVNGQQWSNMSARFPIQNSIYLEKIKLQGKRWGGEGTKKYGCLSSSNFPTKKFFLLYFSLAHLHLQYIYIIECLFVCL